MEVNDLVIEGNGASGIDGKDGLSFVGHAPSGHHGIPHLFLVNYLGSHGGNASKPTNGGDAETIHLLLARPSYTAATDLPGRIIVTVDKHNQQCRSPVPHSQYKEEYPHDLEGLIYLIAGGGNGGDGGDGGDGQGGGHGRDGVDATRHRFGTDGENGCDGGNAGQGTCGGNGGRGGDITVFLKEEDKDILVAMPHPVVKGGQGGEAGRNGVPGPGGRGGYGGSSHSW